MIPQASILLRQNYWCEQPFLIYYLKILHKSQNESVNLIHFIILICHLSSHRESWIFICNLTDFLLFENNWVVYHATQIKQMVFSIPHMEREELKRMKVPSGTYQEISFMDFISDSFENTFTLQGTEIFIWRSIQDMTLRGDKSLQCC